ncbi:hypothetical protein, partial [Xanthomonas perforans]|uniref:hypothetical protein n=1 Tax=Xanthomonas perforans TaxID=442694 RepID=UPI0019CFD882
AGTATCSAGVKRSVLKGMHDSMFFHTNPAEPCVNLTTATAQRHCHSSRAFVCRYPGHAPVGDHRYHHRHPAARESGHVIRQ